MKNFLTTRHKLTSLEIALLGGLGAAVSVFSALSLKVAPVKDFDLLLKGARQTGQAYSEIRARRASVLGRGFDSINDPACSGMIGAFASPITTGPGVLDAKQTAVNPNWAALAIRYLQQAGVRPGDPVAVGMTGSFPGLNIAVLQAIEAYGAKPLWIISQGSTAWGANWPGFTYLDMEKALFDKGLIGGRAVAATLGGNNNAGAELDEAGRAILRASILKQKVPFIDATPLSAAIDSEMACLRRAAGGKRIPLYINIGNGIASLGTLNAASLLSPGLNLPKALAALQAEPVEGVAAKFLAQGALVLNLCDPVAIAKAKGLPIAPAVTPQPGTGLLFFAPRYNLWLDAALLAAYCAVVLAFAHGYTLFLTKNPRQRELL